MEEIVNHAAQSKALKDLDRVINVYEGILVKNDCSPRTLLQKSDVLRLLYYNDPNRYSTNLRHAITALKEVLDIPNVTDNQFRIASNRLVDVFKSSGSYRNAIDIQKKLYYRHPDSEDIINVLGSLYMEIGYLGDAKHMFEKALEIKPDDSTSLLYIGYITFQENKNKINTNYEVDGMKKRKILQDLLTLVVEKMQLPIYNIQYGHYILKSMLLMFQQKRIKRLCPKCSAIAHSICDFAPFPNGIPP